MKIKLNALLVVGLFCSVTFAGDMGSGGRPSGAPVETGTATTSLDSVIVAVVRQYLGLSF